MNVMASLGTENFNHYILRFIEHIVDEQELFRLKLPGYILGISWRNWTSCISHYQALY